MNCILIVGHPSSGYLEVEDALQRQGMASPSPSRREGLLPQDITKNINKLYRVPDLGSATTEEELKPLQVAPIWQGMALDLMLGNMDENLWGWSEPESIYSLDYWRQLDDTLIFVLVYDSPQHALMKIAEDQKISSDLNINHHICNWVAYNTSLLKFFIKNRKRCILISSQQVMLNKKSQLKKVESIVGNQEESYLGNEDKKIKTIISCNKKEEESLKENPPFTTQKILELFEPSCADVEEEQKALGVEITEQYILEQLLSYYPACTKLYSEIQSHANLPLLNKNFNKPCPEKAWNSITQHRILKDDLIADLYEAYTEMRDSLLLLVKGSTSEKEILFSKLDIIKKEFENRISGKKTTCNENIYERVSPKGKEESCIKNHLENINKTNTAIVEEEMQLLNERNEKIQYENKVLLTQLHEAQNDLENYFLKNQESKHHNPAILGAAERIKQELGYRLGATMIQHSGSLIGWLRIPKALAAEHRAWHQKNSKESLNMLPPISTYHDAHEAERIKRHLSYKLGENLIHCKSSLLGRIMLPFALNRSVRQYRLQRRGV